MTSPGQGFTNVDDDALIARWRIEPVDEIRDMILNEMSSRGLYPKEPIRSDEADAGLYPDIEDDEFIQLLMKKREFAESKQDPFSFESEDDPCSTETEFKVTPVQRFIANFLSPKTPYNSALLYHSVGVGKTQAAIQVAEGFLETFPRKKILIVAPGTIQSGFYRNIFDINRVAIGVDSDPNTANQGTGDLYMRLTGTLYEREKATIERKVNDAIRRRYSFFGYLAFRNYIRKVIERRVGKNAAAAGKTRLIEEALRNEFSGRVLIIDEAHHLRDEAAAVEEDEETDTAGAGGRKDVEDTNAGSKLAPYLKQVLTATDGMKLILMTATPMYNTAKEIITLLNFLLMNDKRQTLVEKQLFDQLGNLRKGSSAAKRLLNRAAASYISFMRGENPRTFPVRLMPNPRIINMVTTYPTTDPTGLHAIPEEERTAMAALPIVSSELSGDTLTRMLEVMDEEITPEAAESGRFGIRIRDRLIQAGNFLFPVGEDEEGVGEGGFNNTFRKEGKGIAVKYRCKDGVSADWLASENIGEFSPKAATILDSVRGSKGVCFIYSRFVPTGGLSLALTLEANGYTLVGRTEQLYANGIQSPGGRQCALCSGKERGHTATDHSFAPAKYVLLTGNEEISPKNSDSIAAARGIENKDGRNVKVIIGSQVAAEGVDLRFVREIHIFDSWYHLNKTDQVIGRGIRFCSHSMLPREERNATIFLHCVTFPSSGATATRETIDLYSYRQALKKAKQIGEVSRELKIHALDCNLNRDAIIIMGQPPIRMIDSQGTVRDNVSINDSPFSPLCDWLETCDYTCSPNIKVDISTLDTLEKLDNSTYDEFAARFKDSTLKTQVRNIFATQSFYDVVSFRQLFVNIPNEAYGILLNNILNNKNFHVKHKGIDGYIIYRNKYFLFQPSIIQDEGIPLVLRTTFFNVRRDHFIPTAIEQRSVQELPREEEEFEKRDIASKWSVMSSWATSVVGGSVDSLTDDLLRLLTLMAGKNDKALKRYKNEFEMIPLSVNFFKNKAHLKEAVLQYLFDEWLTVGEQEAAIRGGKDLGCGGENVLKVGSIDVLRFVNVKTGDVEYKRVDGQVLPKSLLDIILSSSTDDVLRRQPLGGQVGPIYGFITTKKGEALVFKQGKPVSEAKYAKSGPDRGAECAIVSETADKIKKIQEIIDIYGGASIDNNTFGSIKNKIAIQLCVVTNLFFRLMDLQRTRRTRWFFRPVASAVSGHKGKA
jgi:hypothetical protein